MTYSHLTTRVDELARIILAGLAPDADLLHSSFNEILAGILGDLGGSGSHLTMSRPQLLAAILNELDGNANASHLTMSEAELLAGVASLSEGATIQLSASSIAEDASINDVVGLISTANKPADWGTSVYTLTSDPDSKFQIANDDELQLSATVDFETKTSHAVQITDTPSGPYDPITLDRVITVTNVIEAPVNLTLPVISGIVQSGHTLSATDGTWTDMEGGSFAYAWEADGTPIDGATASTYLLTNAEIGAVITVVVTATNSADSTAAESDATGAVLDGPDPKILSLAPADDATGVAIDVGELTITFNEDVQFGDVVSITLFNAADEVVESWDETDIDAASEIVGPAVTITLADDLVTGTGYYVQIAAGSVEDMESNAFAGIADKTTWNFSAAADVTAPVLSSAFDTETSDTTANVGATTDEGNGTLYAVSSALEPSAAQIKAGQDSTGAAATIAVSQVVTVIGVQTIPVTGLTAETAYDPIWFMQEDAAENQSNVVGGDGFTTEAAGGGEILAMFDSTAITFDSDAFTFDQAA